jgi:hypothetical protein
MKIFTRVAATVAAVLISTVALAQRGPSGGSRGGGGGPRMSGGAPRGGQMVAPRGGYSGPRGGYSGGSYHGGRGYYGGKGGYYGGRGHYGRGPIYRPYYPYRGYYPYYRPYYPYYPASWYGWGWGWGWGWGGWWGYSPWWGGGYGYGGYGYAPGGYVGVSTNPGRWAGVKTDVSPEEARVYLDGRYIGTADDFDGYPDLLYLQAKGKYKLEFQLEGFESQTVDVDALPGALIKIDNKLTKIPGAKQYGSYNTPEPEGGVQRYFGKQQDGTTGPNVLEEPVQDDPDQYRPPSSPNPNSPSPYRSPSQGMPPLQGDTPPRSVSGDPGVPASPTTPSTPAPGIVGQAPSGRGRIVFRIQPDDAAVYLDDRFAGTGEELSTLGRGLQVTAGPHRVFVTRPGFQSDAVMVDIGPGGSETVEVNLQKP